MTVPDTVTVAPGAAYDGFIASMVTERWPALACSAGLACAGPADASPPARITARIAAGTANAAVFRSVRLRSRRQQAAHTWNASVWKKVRVRQRTLFARDPRGRYSRWPCP